MKLKKKIQEIDRKIEEYLSEMDNADKEERDIPAVDKEWLRKKIEDIKRRKAEYETHLSQLKESGETQVSITDSDGRAMMNNQKIEVCYNVQIAVDEKHKLILDYEVTNEVKDDQHLSEMAKQAKDILGVETLEVVADKGYYNSMEIKECIENGIRPCVSEPESTIPEDVHIYEKEEFCYDAERDVYVCPMDSELSYRSSAVMHGREMKPYRSSDYRRCAMLSCCTRSKRGRTIYHWEDEWMLEETRARVLSEKRQGKKT